MTTSIVAVALIGLSGLLAKLDINDTTEDIYALNVLETLSPIDENKVQNDFRSWLTKEHHKVEDARAALRETLIQNLQQSGVVFDLKFLSGKQRSTVGGETIPFWVIRQVAPESMASNNINLGTVKHRVDYARSLFKKTSWIVATDVAPFTNVKSGTLEEAIFNGDGFFYIKVKDHPYFGSLQKTAVTNSYQTKVNAFKTISAPSTAELKGKDSKEPVLKDLVDRGNLLDRVVIRYGSLPVSDARAIAASTVADGHSAISVLGFSFSPSRLPVIIGCIFLAIVTGILMTVHRMQKLPPSDQIIILDDPMQIAVDGLVRRFIIWALLPPIIIWFSSPSEMPIGDSIILVMLSIMTLLLGAISSLRMGIGR
ncbi:MAG: hypothetical protein GY799_30020 [Desulfobulbaceae bacterium]|nr:hypothetical protein [Desulfobulbaceae bacterium]